MNKLQSVRGWLILILLLAFVLRLYKADSYGLYLDEKYTVVISQGIAMEGANQKDVFFTPGKLYFTPAEFWQEKTIADFIGANIRGDIGNSPFYYGVLWGWTKLFGLSDLSLRFPSILFSTLLVGLLFMFVRRHFQSIGLAVTSALIMAFEPFFIAYSHMARNYSMSFFLTLLATHLFLVILNRAAERRPTGALMVAYGGTFVLALLSHYLSITVFLCHAIYAVFFVRPVKRWVPFLLAGLVGIGLVSLWFVYGGGTYTFKTLAYQAQFYRTIALTNPLGSGFGIVLPATVLNVAVRSAPIWADLFTITNGLGQIDALGARNLATASGLGLLATRLLWRFRAARPVPIWIVLGYGLLLTAALALASIVSLRLVVAAAVPSFVYLLLCSLRREADGGRWPLLVLVLLLATVPTLFLIAMAFRSGHTYGLTQRYSGFSFPFSIILITLLLAEITRIPNGLRLVLGAVLVIQSCFVVQLLYRVYQDRAPKYTYFAEPRMPNPYYLTAQKIRQQYTPGDTVVYPSVRLQPRDEVEKTYWPYSVQDAQLTNLYLPHDAQYWQRMDTTETNKIVLVKSSGQRIVLFDLKGTKYRY